LAPKNNLFNKLKDRKLTNKECKCHLDNNLCLFCGSVGHKVNKCCKKTTAAAKAKA
jgi:hypothetical protein